jgi:hypothetical protein
MHAPRDGHEVSFHPGCVICRPAAIWRLNSQDDAAAAAEYIAEAHNRETPPVVARRTIISARRCCAVHVCRSGLPCRLNQYPIVSYISRLYNILGSKDVVSRHPQRSPASVGHAWRADMEIISTGAP